MYTLMSPATIERLWDKIKPWIASAVGEPAAPDDLDYIKARSLAGQMNIWIGQKPDSNVVDLVFVTEGMVLDNIPTLVLRWLTSSNLDEILPDFGLLECWAKEHGYVRIQVWGRRGWERRLKPLGFVHNSTVLDKFIEQRLH